MKNKNPHAVALGSIKSEKKAKQARLNGKKGGRPKTKTINIKVNLTSLQKKHLSAVEWLLGDSRGDGKTTLMAFVFMKKAMLNPNRDICVFDHHPSMFSRHTILGEIERILPNEIKNMFEISYSRMSIKFKL